MTSSFPPAQNPTSFQQKIRGIAGGLGSSKFSRKLASLYLRLAGGGKPAVFDVDLFGSERAHLHPYDNISEKRVYITPQLWEAEERAALADIVDAFQGDELVFLDIGANAGLYTLYINSVCRARNLPIKVIAAEPDPEMFRRAQNNFKLSGISAALMPVAVTDGPGEVLLTLNDESRGQNSIIKSDTPSAQSTLSVRGKTLEMILDENDVATPDIMKIDIEGAEFSVLTAFFKAAPKSKWPRYILIEGNINRKNSETVAMVMQNGYQSAHATKRNTLLQLV